LSQEGEVLQACPPTALDQVRRMLFSNSQMVVMVLALSMTSAALAADVVIAMMPMNLSDVEVEEFAGFYFEPYSPTPAVARSCYDYCPCSGTPRENISSCECDVAKVCGGDIAVDLSAGTTIEFDWVASSDESKYITIDGTGRTRIEFQATFDCGSDASPPFQEILGADITYEVDAFDRDGSSQSYIYNPSASFVTLGKCDGCGSCEIYTRLQFDPEAGGLKMSFKGIKFSVTYDASNVVADEQVYQWSTSGYCWMRDSQERRQLGGRLLAEDNVYAILELPSSTPTPTDVLASVAKQSFAHGLVYFVVTGCAIFFTN